MSGFVNIISASKSIARCEKLKLDISDFKIDQNELEKLEVVMRRLALHVDDKVKERKGSSVVKKKKKDVNDSKSFEEGSDFMLMMVEQESISDDKMLFAAKEFLKGAQNLQVLDETHSTEEMLQSMMNISSARTLYSYSFKSLEIRMIEQAKIYRKKGLKEKIDTSKLEFLIVKVFDKDLFFSHSRGKYQEVYWLCMVNDLQTKQVGKFLQKISSFYVLGYVLE